MVKLTLWGMNDYLDGQLLDFLSESLPKGTFDPKLMEHLIYMECGDLYPYYQVPSYCKQHIKNFFDRNKEQFKRVWEALYSTYNPIENYDRIENWSDSHSESLSTSSSESVSAATLSSDSQSSSSTGNVSAFNSPTLEPQSASSGQAASNGRTVNDTRGTAKSTRDTKSQDVHGGRVHGNIGVTTTQQMIQQSIDLGSYDIYIWVISLFRKNIISSIL